MHQRLSSFAISGAKPFFLFQVRKHFYEQILQNRKTIAPLKRLALNCPIDCRQRAANLIAAKKRGALAVLVAISSANLNRETVIKAGPTGVSPTRRTTASPRATLS